ncbi:MAG: GIY-YIG nuclease family protein [Coriobacteriales bacterium]|jgi:putative endonuclease|nr:GIY-YIG nuclease family protein [Coriobacteriales bacterium]
MKTYYVYILSNRRNGALYVGITNNLMRRIAEHKLSITDAYTNKHSIAMLVYYEETGDVRAAIAREKQLKKWKREWKIQLIEKTNPNWQDLSLMHIR